MTAAPSHTVEAPERRALGLTRRAALEPTVVVALTALAGLVFAWTKAPLYNPRGTIDPWLYTALWTNFHQIYHSFITTYYASRVPWIVPGYVLNALFGLKTAYFVVHVVYFFAGALFVYFACRRYFGWIPATTAYGALIANQMYFNAHRWDYEEGAVLAYLAAATYFATPLTTTSRIRIASLLAAGFFSAALVTTQLLDAFFLLGLPVLWWASLPRSESGFHVRQIGRDLGAYASGVILLLGLCGAFAFANGGRFLFFMPQVNVVRSTNGEFNQAPPLTWLPHEPYFFVPIFVMALAALLLVVTPRMLGVRSRRMVIGAISSATLVFAVIAAWEFLSTGFFFEYSFYFSAFLVPIALVLGGVAAIAEQALRMRGGTQLLVTAIIGASVGPLAWLYNGETLADGPNGMWSRPYQIMVITMVVALTLAAFTLFDVRGRLAALATVAGFFAFSFGIHASYSTYLWGASDPTTGDMYELGSKQINFLRANGFARTLPRFWYDNTAPPSVGVLRSLQSLYYYNYTYVGIAMPKVDDDFRLRMQLFNPEKLVLLCPTRSCNGGIRALREAGYRIAPVKRQRLASGSLSYWLEIYRVT